ncbi:hypothetical protein MSG28_007298 [Choristoneura fumiferana]|uniref:Uncharacterized protein n=1 Tax=Choristoneura fumiferana TaxID=7141 RepID=A0ACC0JWT6_CHOFU|nr:hypothetical protein MSG28_007298 [Choristoneura fumiferana]
MCTLFMATPAQEAEDERHDAEMLAAVRNSMKQWEQKRARTRKGMTSAQEAEDERHDSMKQKRARIMYVFSLKRHPDLNSRLNRGQKGVLSAQESEDEQHYAEMLAAVRDSMKQWEQKRTLARSKRSQGSVCYGDFGCFEDSGPFAYLETLPSPPHEVGTHFLLYSTVSSNMSAAWGWAARAFDAARPTRVIVHGFGSNCDNVWVYEMRSALMAVFQDPRARLDRGDAKFVDVIHSNGETLILGGLGAAQPLGHVDFYPNGGRVQHGCSNLFVGAVSDFVLPWAAASVEGRSLCNHRRAYKFFTDSVREVTTPSAPRFTHMIVPHPALGVPLRATLHYAAYSGWLSAGAKAIRLDKLLIADSFGKTSSFCKKGLQLLSDEAVELPLYPGDCQVREIDENANSTSDELIKREASTKAVPIDLHDNELSDDTPQRPFQLVDNSEWTGADSGRAFGMTNTKTAASGVVEIAEPVLRPRQHKTSRQRADAEHPPEISEPLLRATQPPRPTTPPPARKAKNYDISTTPTYEPQADQPEKEETGFAVQFLPSRLASFISRAERYARDTLLPLVSAYAPRLPIFGSRDLPKPTARYIPMDTTNITSSVPIPTPTLEMKIESLKGMGPPGEKREIESPEDPEVSVTSSTATPSAEAEKLRAAPSEMLQVVSGPSVSTSTALPPMALRSDGEKILIVYPSNARDERKIRSHSYPEELQFEALYRHTAAPAVRVDLPTFTPPVTSPTPPTREPAAKPDRYIPVPFPKSQDKALNNATALGNLCCDCDTSRKLLHDQEGVILLTNLLKTSLDDNTAALNEIKIFTTKTILNYGIGGQQFSESLVESGVIELIRRILVTELDSDDMNDDFVSTALLVLSVISDNTPEVLFEPEVNRAVLNVLQETTNIEISELCLEHLHAQAEHAKLEGVELMCCRLEQLVRRQAARALRADDADVEALIKQACDLIIIVLTGDDAMHNLYDNGNGAVYQTTVRWLESPNPHLLSTGVLAHHHKLALQLKKESGDISTSTKIQHAALSALRNLIVPVANKQAAARSGRAAPALLAALPAVEDHQVAYKLLAALRMLVDGQECVARVLAADAAALAAVARWGAAGHAGAAGEAPRLLAWSVKQLAREPALWRHYLQVCVCAAVAPWGAAGHAGAAGEAPRLLAWSVKQLAREPALWRHYLQVCVCAAVAPWGAAGHAGAAGEAPRLLAWSVKQLAREPALWRHYLQVDGCVSSLVNMLVASHSVMQNEAILALTLLAIHSLKDKPAGPDFDYEKKLIAHLLKSEIEKSRIPHFDAFAVPYPAELGKITAKNKDKIKEIAKKHKVKNATHDRANHEL